MRNVWTFTKQKETNMGQAPTVPSPVDAHKKQDAIEAMRSLSLQDQKDALQQLGLTPPGKQVNDWIWLTIVVSFAIVLVGAFIALALAVFLYGKLSGELLLTVFATSAAFLAGLLTPSPTQAKPPAP
jgi:ABC-type phosphate/phosphonate transport system permease subunit